MVAVTAVPCLKQTLPAQSELAVQGSPSAPVPLPAAHAPELHTCPELQAAQAAPPFPHCDVDWAVSATQVLPLQHPPGQVVALHGVTQAPEVQDWPAEQALQAVPPLPHWATVCADPATQVVPLQQPLGQVVPSHGTVQVPALHTFPAAQAEQAVPAFPHWDVDCADGATQVVPLQQPDGQVVALHVAAHAPELQAWPEAQTAHAAPPLPHWETDCADWATQVLPLQQPDGQVVALQLVPPPVPDGAQAPEVHASPVAQPLHAAPPLPHWAFDCAV